MSTSPSPRHTGSFWPTVGILLVGALLVAAVSLGALRNVAAGQPGATPAASPSSGSTPVASPNASPGASPVAGITTAPGQGGNDQQANEAINSITQRIVHGNPILARAQGPTAGEAVFDPYGILTSDQTNALAGDAGRLKSAGLPTLIYIRISLNDQAQSQQFAQSLVTKPGVIESSKGAQDGMVVLVSIPPGAPQKGNVAIAYGKNALPVNGLNATTIQQIEQQYMVPRLKQGQVFPALQYGVRQFNYVVAYTPYSFPKLSSTARSIGKGLSFVAPVLAALTILLLVVTWFPGAAQWRQSRGAGWRRWLARWWPGALAGALCAAVIPLSVYARTRIGIFAAAAVLVAILLDLWVTADRASHLPSRRIIPATASLPAKLATRRRAIQARGHVQPPGDGQGTLE